MYNFLDSTGRTKGLVFMALGLMMFLIVLGCTNVPLTTAPPGDPKLSGSSGESGSSRVLWGYYFMHLNDDHTVLEVEPARGVQFHFNALGMIEKIDPELLAIDDYTIHDDDTITAIISITHPVPEDQPRFTGFDVRGIVMFPQSYEFPEIGVGTTGIEAGQSALLNADGYTRRWNPTEYSDWPMPFSYYDGLMIQPGYGSLCTSLVNPFKTFYTSPERRIFEVSKSDLRHYHLSFKPGPMVFAYAIDASWGIPAEMDDEGQPEEVPDSFGLTCNSVEPYDIRLVDLAGKMESSIGLYASGSVNLSISVNDYQGGAIVPYESINVEAPDLFEGVVHPWSAVGDSNHCYYQVVVPNENAYEPGTYPALLALETNDEDPSWASDDPLTAYLLFTLDVVEINPPFCEGINTVHSVGPGIHQITGTYGAVHIDCDFMPPLTGSQGKLLFDGGISGGDEHIQRASISGTGGTANAVTLILREGSLAGNATIIQCNEFNGHLIIATDNDPDNLLIYDEYGILLDEFDLGSGTNEPVCLDANPANGDIWLVGHKGTQGIDLERWTYIQGGGGSFQYLQDHSSTVDLLPYFADTPKPLGIAINTHMGRLYFFHGDSGGSIEVFEIAELPPTHNEAYSRTGVLAAPVTPTEVPGLRRLIGGDILVDHADGDAEAECRLLCFGNTLGGTAARLTRLDVWCQTLAIEHLSQGYACVALNNLPDVGDRSLILFPLTESQTYSMYLAPPAW